MVASIGKIASPARGVGYFEKDGYYARDDGAHREASAWAGKGADALGLSGPVDPEAFRRVELPPMNWSTVKVSNRRTDDGHQASSTRGDCREAAPG